MPAPRRNVLKPPRVWIRRGSRLLKPAFAVPDPVVGGTEITAAADDWTGSNGTAWDTGRWSTTPGTGTIDIQNNEGRIVSPATAFATNYARALTGVLTDTELLVKVKYQQVPNADLWFGLRCTNADGHPDDGYIVVLNQGGAGDQVLYRRQAGSQFLATVNTLTLVAGTSYWLRFRCSGTTIAASFWPVGTTEPGSFQASVTDAVYASGAPKIRAGSDAVPVCDARLDNFRLGNLGAAAANAPAGLASGTGTADNASVALGVNAEAATGTGAAPDPLGSIGANAEVATGTGTAPGPQTTVIRRQDFEGGTNTTAISAGNSASATSDAVTGVTVGAGGSVTYTTARSAHGTVAMRAVGSTSAGAARADWAFTGTPVTTGFGYLHAYLTANPSGDTWLLALRDPSLNAAAGLIVRANGHIACANNGTAGTEGTVSIPLNTWVRFELESVAHASAGSVTVRWFNSDSGTAGDTVTQSGINTLASFGQVEAGLTFAPAAVGTVDFDDFAFSSVAMPAIPAATGSGPAELASGTGSAPQPTVAITANDSGAAGTGTANAPTPAVGINAEAATGTGSAPDPTVSTTGSANAPAGLASGTGAAPDPTVAITVNPDAGIGFGEAFGSSQVAATIDAGLASGSGAALDATVQTTSPGTGPAELASGTGQALAPTVAITVNADQATGTGTAPDATGAVGPAAEVASGAGVALSPAIAITANADQATGTGLALDATVSTLAINNAPADVAVGTGTAPDPTPAVGANADQAAGTGSAPQPTVAVGIDVPAELATGTGLALDATVAVGVPAGVAVGTGVAEVAAGTPGRDAPAGGATGTGAAPDATAAVGVPAGVATGTGLASDATVPPPVPPPRWVEHDSDAGGVVEGVLVGAGIVEGSSSL